MITLNGIKVTPTIFPDKTSQVWKVDGINNTGRNVILWRFENEAEFIHLAQLVDLLRETTESNIQLVLPYLPYARQDKSITNDSTFALRTFGYLLSTLPIDFLSVLDAHSRVLEDCVFNGIHINFIGPEIIIKRSIDKYYDCVCFPDKGAYDRYNSMFSNTESIYCEKVRDQDTGKITSYKIVNDTDIAGKSVLVIDDICDGGATFNILGDSLWKFNIKDVLLYVTHGVFSKGLDQLLCSYSKIYTTSSVYGIKERFQDYIKIDKLSIINYYE